MSTPKKNWEENWQKSFDEGFYDNIDGLEAEKTALLVETDAQGNTKVVGTATGAEAQRLIADAKASGLEVRQDASQVEDLMQEQSGSTDVPTEIYELMSSILDFAQELGQEWTSQKSGESLLPPEAPRRATELEFTHADVK